MEEGESKRKREIGGREMGIGGREERERQMEEGERKREIGGREMGIGREGGEMQ